MAQRPWGLGATVRGMWVPVVLDRRPLSGRTMVWRVSAVMALVVVVIGLPALLTWSATHDGGWTAMAAVCAYVGSTFIGVAGATVVDRRRARRAAPIPNK